MIEGRNMEWGGMPWTVWIRYGRGAMGERGRWTYGRTVEHSGEVYI